VLDAVVDGADVGSLEGSVTAVELDDVDELWSVEDVVGSVVELDDDVDSVVVVEPVVVEEPLVGGSSAGTTFTLSEDLSTLAAAAVTPPTPRATTAASAASFAVRARMGTGARPFSPDATIVAITATASSSPARSSGRDG
jgi:hypothetical protein